MKPSEFLKMGIAVIPVYPKSKKPAVRWRDYQRVLPKESQFQIWFRPDRDPAYNAAVICGWRGLVVLDFDDQHSYSAWLVWTVKHGGEAWEVAEKTYRVKTARGMHLYLFVDETLRCSKFDYGDIKGIGGYVLIPPSVHPSGAQYVAVDESASIVHVSSLTGIIPNAPQPPIPSAPLTHVYQSSALWPGTLVEQIKASVSILSLFPDAKPTGGLRWWRARCPLHDDSDPSLWIDLDRGLCGCYAGCTVKPLDVIGMFARIHGLDNAEAIKRLAREVLK
jgi:hypothetical protein